MGDIVEKKPSKHICVGLLAHVDAGKTTLSEAMLYTAGSIRRLGRVDNQDAFLDTDPLERSRGITIFSKQASFLWEGMEMTLLDTPGHVDFGGEMERTLQVLDYGVLIISAADGVQGHTRTLWKLLARYRIPVFLFVNKMDREEANRETLMTELREMLSEGCVDFSAGGEDSSASFYETLAMSEEGALEEFLETGKLTDETVRGLIQKRCIFPCYFGSALRLTGVTEFMTGMSNYCKRPEYPSEFAARVFKIARDEQGNRLTFLKITGGSLQVRSEMPAGEKVNQIRLYSGERYRPVESAKAGEICAVTGLLHSFSGQGLGREEKSWLPLLEPVITCCLKPPADYDAALLLPKLRLLEEEDPLLHVAWLEKGREIQVQVMGQVQLEVLKSRIAQRFGVLVEFGPGQIIYKETIAAPVEGVGHFEPLRHYAEVHLLLEPLPAGSGLQFAADCSRDELPINWQRLVLTHLVEKEHKGALTGSAITDMRLTLVGGRGHLKHTEGGDFREATYRAVRQGLLEAQGVLLEPYYDFRLELPQAAVGRAMTELGQMGARFDAPRQEKGRAVLLGSGPVSELEGYARRVLSYTKGEGRFSGTLRGYEPCHNAQEVVERCGYLAEADLENPASSIFCAHGAGYVVEWDKVKDFMHVESCVPEKLLLPQEKEQREPVNGTGNDGPIRRRLSDGASVSDIRLGTDEVDAILSRAGSGNRRENGAEERNGARRIFAQESTAAAVGAMPAGTAAGVSETAKKGEKKPEYLLVDGYNVIFAWEDLKELAEVTIDGARGKLMDVLCNYQAIRGCELILVFDAYRVSGHREEMSDYHNIHVVYTKEAETADRYIEKFAHENGRRYRVTVATSDGLEQIIIRGQGCSLMSARELKEEVERAADGLRESWPRTEPGSRHYLGEHMPARDDSDTL